MVTFTKAGDKVSINYGSHGRAVPSSLLLSGLSDQVYIGQINSFESGPDVLQFSITEISGRPSDDLVETVEYLTSTFFNK